MNVEVIPVAEMREARLTEITLLRPHPRNYHDHPDDQIEHIVASIRQHGIYRNVVAARDGTLLAGHGVVKAARKIGLKVIPVIHLDIDPDDVRALKVLAGDNEIGKLAMPDDRALTELLREVMESGTDEEDALLGTGFDEAMLAALVLNTRTEDEIRDKNAAAEWVGMPEYQEGEDRCQLLVNFDSPEVREQFIEHFGITVTQRQNAKAWSTRWPDPENRDLASLRFEG